MKKYHSLKLVLLWAALMAEAGPLQAQRPRPVMDFTSILNSLDVAPLDGALEFNKKAPLFAAFVPPASVVDVVFRKIGEPIELHSTVMDIDEFYGKFTKARAIGPLDDKKLGEPGDYLVTYRCNGVPMTRLKVSLTLDQENPAGSYRLDGPWQQWVQLRTPLGKNKQDTPRIACWLRNPSGQPDQPVTYSFQIRKDDGELVYESNDASVSNTQWKCFLQELRFPLNIGGNLVTPIEFFNRNGNFTLQIRQGEKLYGNYPFQVIDGRLRFHPRQKTGYMPYHEYLITRFAGEKKDGSQATNVYWLERASGDSGDALADATSASGDQLRITAAQRENWRWAPSTSDPKRKFELVVTSIGVDDRTHLAVGDDLIVFGTGYPRGVAYLNVGQSELTGIPQGESYDSRLFWACGKKLVLIKHKSIAIYDTTTGETSPVDANEVVLYEVKGGLYRSNMIHADGNLVAVVNDLSLIKDQRTIKVIDLGGENPVVIPLRNGKFIPPEVSGIAIDAESEMVVVASWQRKTVYYAKLEPDAEFVELNLSNDNGISRKQFHVIDNGLLYADLDNHLRYVKFGKETTPLLLSDGAVGIGGAGFYANGGRIAMATQKPSGTRFPIAVADFPEIPKLVEGTGRPIAGTTGEYGMAGHATVTADGTIFLSGTPGGGIGIGEYLQVLHSTQEQWQPVVDASAQPLQAIDVVAGPRLLAFKTGGYNTKTTVAYATHGDVIEFSEIPTTANPLNPNPETANNDPAAEMSEQDLQLIQNYQDVENELKKSFSDAIGEMRGAKQARKAILDVMRKDGKEQLIDAYIALTDDP